MINFDKYYYNHCCGEPYERNDVWMNLFGGIADRIVEDIHPVTALDAGCAMGFLVECLRRRGVESFGLDISEYAIQNVHPEFKPYCRVGSVIDRLPQRYDLIISIEVLEHMSKDQADIAIKNLCNYTDDILFSSTPFDYKEITHINVQRPEYWAEQFARSGFFRDVDFDASFITPWAARFRRSKDPVHQIVRNYERSFALLSKEATDLRALNYEMRADISKDEDQIENLNNQIKDLGDQAKILGDQNKNLSDHITVLTEQNRRLARELSELYNSRGWRLFTRLQQFRGQIAPSGSRRDRILTGLLRIFK